MTTAGFCSPAGSVAPLHWPAIAVAVRRKLVKRYIVKRGVRDGTPGLISALHSATAQFRAHALVWDERNRRSRTEFEAEVERLWRLETPDY